MGDQFEKYINSRRDQFEIDGPGDELWSKIESGLPANSKPTLNIWWKIAAVLFLFSTIVLIVDRNTQRSEDQPDQLLVEFRQAEAFYSQLITQKKNELKDNLNEELSRELLKDIENLDQSYSNLKETYKEEVNDEKLLNAMIQNLQLQLDILNQQMKIIEDSKTEKNEKDNNYNI